ncbi:hypothetical protein R3P38DRAFT_3182453 [Favolaschia claudopus]|uniref:CxC2-like cysteine cluster KDZ transposase-associated domain-containing protein n=1 Tax=Favolaschia claudopus TaxID=2862362 RepID=A0AAW0CHH3_9AGAR
MSFNKDRKKLTEILLSRTPAALSLTATQPVFSATTGRTSITLLRHKTSIRRDGRVAQQSSVLEVTSSTTGPVYECYTAADDGDEFDEGDDDARAPRASGVGDHRDVFLPAVLTHIPLYPLHEWWRTRVRALRCLAVQAHAVSFDTGEYIEWTGSHFERRTLQSLGLHIELRHWDMEDPRCPLPEPAFGADFVIVDDSGVGAVNLDVCGCGLGRHYTVQLLRARLWASTTTSPRTAATCAALEFYQSLARQIDNLDRTKDKNRYHGFLRMTRQWRNIQMLKRATRGHDPAGISATMPGEWALLCPACRHPDLTLPSDCWQRSHCVAHDVVDKLDREAQGTASSGVGAVDCARHNMKRREAVGDLQLGERYLNMDYMVFTSIHVSRPLHFIVPYDIACQWHIKICDCTLEYKDTTLTVDGRDKFFTFLVPNFHLPAHIEECNLKFSFNLTRDVGQTDGEAPERRWLRVTDEDDIFDDHWGDWNHTRIIASGYAMRKKIERAVPEMVKTRLALDDMKASLESKTDQHVAKVRAEFADKAGGREAAGKEDERAVRGDMHLTELITMGLQLVD